MNVVITLPKQLIIAIIEGTKTFEMRKCRPKHMKVGVDGFFVEFQRCRQPIVLSSKKAQREYTVGVASMRYRLLAACFPLRKKRVKCLLCLKNTLTRIALTQSLFTCGA